MSMLLKLYVEPGDLYEKYLDAIVAHNEKMKGDYPDAGFDLFVHKEEHLRWDKTTLIDSHVKCSAWWLNKNDEIQEPAGFYVYPRSSISKTPLRMANSVGIIDSGYRGNLKFAVDAHKHLAKDDESTYEDSYHVKEFTRLFQICSPTMCKIKAIMVSSENELGETQRGQGGFGSTGQ